MFSGDYNAEQKALEEAIPEKETRLENLKASAAQQGDVYRKSKAVYRHRWTRAGIAAADDPADRGGRKE